MTFKELGQTALVIAALLLAGPLAAQDVAYTERRTFVFGESPENVTERAEVEVRYLSPRSTGWREFGAFEQYFGPIQGLRAELNGSRLRGDAIQKIRPESADVFLSSGTYHQISLPEAPKPGDVMAYSYRRTYLSAAYVPILRVPSIDRLAEYVIDVEHPSTVQVEFRIEAPRGEVPHEITTTARGTRLTFRDLKPLDDLPLFAHNGVHAFVMLDVRKGPLALTPTAPDEFAAWYATLTQHPVPATILPVAKGMESQSDSATVASFHDYVRQSIRYIADERDAGAFVPRAPDLVMERSYGDCKDRAFLISALAKSLGLQVDPVLISTEPEPEFEDVHLTLYNHVICSFEHDDGTRTYFDPTNPYLSFGDLPESDIDGLALRMGPDGAERLFVESPSTDPTLDLRLSVDLDAPEASGAERTVRGTLLEMVRAIEARSTETDARNALSAVAGDLLTKIRLSGLEFVSESPRSREYRSRADLSQFVIASPTKRYLPLTPFRAIDPDVTERREDALQIRTADRPNVRLRLDVSGAWQPDSTDTTFGDARGPVWFEARAEPLAEGSVVEYSFGQRTKRFNGEDRAAYLSLADAYLGARRDVITFRSPSDE